ncbi:Asp-tRNA(Asn)/Glu-tRNA(Gln) amidotransferase GatCAB subunit C [Candidatus Woesearchaeota archaeon]|nr:Asp-tRNA(Asn)/Glu-tRNA(Gln) amidotransferase GatCAB subunit C [Candidatus Woesearchaeota archaeon]
MPTTTKQQRVVDAPLLRKVAANARLSLTEEEIKLFLPQMKEILATFSVLDQVKTTAAWQPMQATELREDKAAASLAQEEALQGTAATKGYIKGPRV